MVGVDLTAAGWPATGRVIRVPMWGLTEREVRDHVELPAFVDRVIDGGYARVRNGRPGPDLKEYVHIALRGGYPELAEQHSASARRQFVASYVDQLVTRDVSGAAITRDPVRLRRYLQAAAASTAGTPEHKTVYDAAAINRLTALAYDDLLQAIFVTDHVPAWAAGRLGRLVGLAKRYLTDAALMAPLLGVDERGMLRDADLLGRLIDTFVVSQLRAELPVSRYEPRLFHLRDANGRREVDLLAELPDGRVVAFEIKANAGADRSAARHLMWLRDQLGERLVAGIVFHTGPLPSQIDERIFALPICTLWSG